jgi:hypothetical protein
LLGLVGILVWPVNDMEPRAQSVLGQDGQAIADALVSDLEIIITSWLP